MATKCYGNNKDYNLIDITTSDVDINNIANNFIKLHNINVQQSTGFNSMLLYISNNIKMYSLDKNNKPDYSDIDKLNYYFNIYAQLCSLCNILPDLTGFSIYSNIPYDTLKEWKDGHNRSTTHTPVVKRWNYFCKSTCVSDAGRGNVGAIYVSKAVHGLSDQRPQFQLTQNNLHLSAPLTREQIAAEFGRSCQTIADVKSIENG